MAGRAAAVWSKLLRGEDLLHEQFGATYPLVRLDVISGAERFQ
jgi:hypothetical protein